MLDDFPRLQFDEEESSFSLNYSKIMTCSVLGALSTLGISCFLPGGVSGSILTLGNYFSDSSFYAMLAGGTVLVTGGAVACGTTLYLLDNLRIRICNYFANVDPINFPDDPDLPVPYFLPNVESRKNLLLVEQSGIEMNHHMGWTGYQTCSAATEEKNFSFRR